MENPEIFIKRCLYLAQKAIGNTYPNPLVGSVIVAENKIIGEGYHKKAGCAHAEINVFSSVDNCQDLTQSQMYVSLEPCAHFGKTPPCANAIVEAKVPKVLISSQDSHPKVNGKGIEILENNGVEVTTGILSHYSKNQNKRFFTFHEKKRPFIILKWAESADGFIDKNGGPTAISNSLVNQFVHLQRAQEQSIMIGTTTALRDNPSLTVRHVLGKNPTRIIIDRTLKIPRNYSIFNNEAKTFIINEIKEEQTDNLHFVKIDFSNLISSLLFRLFEMQIQSVIVEGGANLLNQFINAGVWDEAFVLKNSDLFLKSGTLAPKFHHKAKYKKNFRNTILEYHKYYENATYTDSQNA